MGILDQLWDDTLAGPAPDSGLGKLRKHPAAFTSKESNGKSNSEKGTAASPSSKETAVTVSRRIMIVKPPGYHYGSPPISPPPPSPLSDRESFRFRRRSRSDGCEKTTSEVRLWTPTSPYDM